MNAVRAAVAVAAAHGVRCERPVVLREAWHVLVHLQPAPVVARVTSGAAEVDPADVLRELSVAAHAIRAGAPVVPPADLLPPGPHLHHGHTLVFWRYLEQTGDVDPVAAGHGLRAIHDALGDYAGELPPAGRAEDVRTMLAPLPASDDAELLCELAARPLPGDQAVHGDAHLANCIQTAAGPIWHDLETAGRGPREYDLAALLLRDRETGQDPQAWRAAAAYGAHDEDMLERALPVYGAWVAASLMSALHRRPAVAPTLERHLRYLRPFRR